MACIRFIGSPITPQSYISHKSTLYLRPSRIIMITDSQHQCHPTIWRLLLGSSNTRRLGAANNFILFTVMIDFWKSRNFVGQPRKGKRIGYDEVVSCTWTVMTLKHFFLTY